MIQKICLKCLDMPYGDKEYCNRCGHKLVEFSLACECGKEIRPYFGYRFFPPWGRSIINKHCLFCGKNIEKRIWDYIKVLKKMAQ